MLGTRRWTELNDKQRLVLLSLVLEVPSTRPDFGAMFSYVLENSGLEKDGFEDVLFELEEAGLIAIDVTPNGVPFTISLEGEAREIPNFRMTPTR